MVGTNDHANGDSAPTIVPNIRKIVEIIKTTANKPIQVTVLAIPPDAKLQKDSANQGIKTTNQQLAKYKGYSFVNTPTLWKFHLCADYRYIGIGGVHLTHEGGKMVQNIFEKTKRF